MFGGGGHDHAHDRAAFAQAPDEIQRLIGRNAAADDEQDTRGGEGSPSHITSPLRFNDRERGSVSSGCHNLNAMNASNAAITHKAVTAKTPPRRISVSSARMLVSAAASHFSTRRPTRSRRSGASAIKRAKCPAALPKSSIFPRGPRFSAIQAPTTGSAVSHIL